MAKKETFDKEIEEIRKNLDTGKLIFGTKKTLQNLKTAKLSKVYHSINCPDDVKAELKRYGSLSGSEVVALNHPNDELGVICKKPFSISVIGLLKT